MPARRLGVALPFDQPRPPDHNGVGTLFAVGLSNFTPRRRCAMRFCHIVVCLLVVAWLPAAWARAEDRQPNFVIILSDDQGYADVGCYGAEGFTTPNLDRMADEGMRFLDFHVASSVCSPSRAALLTGCYPQRVGLPVVLEADSAIGLNADEETLPELLKQAGYATGHGRQMALGRPAAIPAHAARLRRVFRHALLERSCGRGIRPRRSSSPICR